MQSYISRKYGSKDEPSQRIWQQDKTTVILKGLVYFGIVSKKTFDFYQTWSGGAKDITFPPTKELSPPLPLVSWGSAPQILPKPTWREGTPSGALLVTRVEGEGSMTNLPDSLKSWSPKECFHSYLPPKPLPKAMFNFWDLQGGAMSVYAEQEKAGSPCWAAWEITVPMESSAVLYFCLMPSQHPSERNTVTRLFHSFPQIILSRGWWLKVRSLTHGCNF